MQLKQAASKKYTSANLQANVPLHQTKKHSPDISRVQGNRKHLEGL